MSKKDDLKGEWFEFGREAGKREATERIIKLLEAHPCYSLTTCQEGCLAHDLLIAHIALIKGDNK